MITHYFRQTIREHWEIIEWLQAHTKKFNCGCDELLDEKGNAMPQPLYHNCNYIRTRNRHIPFAIRLASNSEGLDRRHFSVEMDRYGRTL